MLLSLLLSFQISMRQQIPSLVAAEQVLFIWKHHEIEAQSFVIVTLEVKRMKQNTCFHHYPTNEFLQQPFLRKWEFSIQGLFWDFTKYCGH